jgi:hypothetical protein
MQSRFREEVCVHLWLKKDLDRTSNTRPHSEPE